MERTSNLQLSTVKPRLSIKQSLVVLANDRHDRQTRLNSKMERALLERLERQLGRKRPRAFGKDEQRHLLGVELYRGGVHGLDGRGGVASVDPDGTREVHWRDAGKRGSGAMKRKRMSVSLCLSPRDLQDTHSTSPGKASISAPSWP